MISKISNTTLTLPKPRLCRLVNNGLTNEFGFNLHAEQGKGHFIGAVKEGGIADCAGLETGQRIVGINGQLIYSTTPHKEIVALIKRNLLITELLVASEEVDKFYSRTGTPYSFENAKIYKTSHYCSNNATNLENDTILNNKSNHNCCKCKSFSHLQKQSNVKNLKKNNYCFCILSEEKACKLCFNLSNTDQSNVIGQALIPIKNKMSNTRQNDHIINTENYFLNNKSMQKFSTTKKKNCDIFKLNAKDALSVMREYGNNKKTCDPRLNSKNNLSLTEKYNRIANL